MWCVKAVDRYPNRHLMVYSILLATYIGDGVGRILYYMYCNVSHLKKIKTEKNKLSSI